MIQLAVLKQANGNMLKKIRTRLHRPYEHEVNLDHNLSSSIVQLSNTYSGFLLGWIYELCGWSCDTSKKSINMWCLDAIYSIRFKKLPKKKDQKIEYTYTYPGTRDESKPMTHLFFTALQGHKHVERNLQFELTKQHKLIHATFGKKVGLGENQIHLLRCSVCRRHD